MSKHATRDGPEVVRAALLQCWIRSNDVSDKCLRGCEQTEKFCATVDPRQWQPLCERLQSDNHQLSLKNLEHGLELLNGGAKRREQGIVYTPNSVIDYLLETAIGDVTRRNTVPAVCDPACGSGGFLLRAAELLSTRFDMTFGRALRDHVVGIDRDPTSLANARCLIELALAREKEFVRPEDLRLIDSDSLLAPAAELLSLAGISQGFDVVASNPPYVKLQNLDLTYRQQLEQRYRPFIKGSYSLALLFLLAGHRMLATAGCLAFITQNNLFTSLAGEPIRELLQQQGYLRRILDFGHTKVFDKAAAYTCLVFLSNEPQDEFEYSALEELPHRDSLRRVEYSRVSTSRLNKRKWRLAKPHHLDNLERIEQAGKPLVELADIRVGFATLKDSVFLVRDLGHDCVATSPGGESVPVEREITRPAVKVADVACEQDLRQQSARIIFPYSMTGRGHTLIPEARLRDEFPCAFAHLVSCRELLGRRDKGKGKAEAWYAWGRTQGRESLGPKLLTKTFDCRPNFMLDPSHQLFCNGYSVSMRSSAPEWLTIEILQHILNSPVMHYYAKLTSFQIAGGYQCYQKNFIERFGIPPLTRDNADAVSTMQADSRDRFIATKLYRLDYDELLQVVGAVPS